jgi:hypothetical protein
MPATRMALRGNPTQCVVTSRRGPLSTNAKKAARGECFEGVRSWRIRERANERKRAPARRITMELVRHWGAAQRAPRVCRSVVGAVVKWHRGRGRGGSCQGLPGPSAIKRTSGASGVQRARRQRARGHPEKCRPTAPNRRMGTSVEQRGREVEMGKGGEEGERGEERGRGGMGSNPATNTRNSFARTHWDMKRERE